jgi:hypothetical protein
MAVPDNPRPVTAATENRNAARAIEGRRVDGCLTEAFRRRSGAIWFNFIRSAAMAGLPASTRIKGVRIDRGVPFYHKTIHSSRPNISSTPPGVAAPEGQLEQRP